MAVSIWFAAFLLVFFHSETAAQANKSNVIGGQFIVKLKDGADVNSINFGARAKHSHIKENKQLSAQLNIWLLYIDTAENTSIQLLQQLRQNENILLAQHNHHISLRQKIPSDSLFPRQWNLNNAHNQPGTSRTDIQITEAWQTTTGGTTPAGDTIVIAVIDNGFDMRHEDIDYWRNHYEIPGNGIDDDENGYADDYYGWNVFNRSDSIPNRFHGTQVAGIAAARGNNNTGISGVNWHVKTLAVAGSSETEAEVVSAYSYIYTLREQYNRKKTGAYVVCTNTSFGVDFGKADDFPIWCEMYNALGSLGVLNVAATANAGINLDSAHDIPSSCTSPYLITVTSANQQGRRDPVTAFGKNTVDIAAPGVSIFTTQPGGYGTVSGTSFAAPHVAGSIALLYAHPCTKFIKMAADYPQQNALYIKEMLLRNAEVGEAFTDTVAAGGILNVNKAMAEINKLCETETIALDLLQLYPNPASNLLTVQFIKTSPGQVKINIVNMLGQVVSQQLISGDKIGLIYETLDIKSLKQGAYLLSVSGQDTISQPVKFIVYCK